MQRQCDKAFSVMSTKTPKKNDNKVSKRKTCNWWERVKRGGDSEVAILAFPEEGEIGEKGNMLQVRIAVAIAADRVFSRLHQLGERT